MGDKARLARRLLVPLIAVVTGLAGLVGSAAPASAQFRPQPGATPAVTASAPGHYQTFYTGTDKVIYDVSWMGGTFTVGGRAIGGPAVATVPQSFLAVFVRGTDSALWWYRFGVPPRWASLGGGLTSKPGAAASATRLDVVARGTDGAVWHRTLTTGGWSPWATLGGGVLAGTGPAAVYVGGTLDVALVGTDHALWLNSTADGVHWSGWRSLGGRVVSDPGLAAPAAATGAVYVRGSDNAAWYEQFAGTTPGVTPGWHSLGGRLTSGVGVATTTQGYPVVTYVFVLGGDAGLWYASGVWPAITGWVRQVM